MNCEKKILAYEVTIEKMQITSKMHLWQKKRMNNVTVSGSGAHKSSPILLEKHQC